MIRLLTCLFGLMLAAQDGGARKALEISNGTKPGQFQVANMSGSPIRLAMVASIERETPGTSTWVNLGIAYRLIAACPATPDHSVEVILEAHATLAPVAWTGYDCEAQCDRPCRMNGWAGAGTYRLVVTSADGQNKWAGPSFQLGKAPR